MARNSASRVSIAVVAAVLLLTGGAVAAQLLFPTRTPLPLQAGSRAQTFTVTPAQFDDARAVRVALTTDADVTLALPAATGRVTQTVCAPNRTIVSGQIAAHIDDQSILALHTSVPLWRDLTWGDTGSDVTALRTELNRLGAGIAADGSVDGEVMHEVATRLVPEGTNPPHFDSIPVDRLLWLPHPEVQMIECGAGLGVTVEGATVFGKIRGSLTSAQVVELPPDLTPGTRTLKVAGVTVPVSASGLVDSAEALNAIASTAAFQTTQDSENTQPAGAAGVLALAEAAQMWQVPPAAVFAVDGTSACITSNGSHFRVRIVGSKLGKTFLLPDTDEVVLPHTVDLPDTGEATCTNR